jgi:hypothetical protein
LSIRVVGERQAIWLVTAVGAICRLAALRQPMRYDEAVTWAYFVGRGWGEIVSSYPFPNNHVFFSLLAKLASSPAPFQPWALRLPAFVAGVAIIPLTWAVGRRFARPAVGLIGAALAAGSTTLIVYSTNARGYSLVVALFLVLLLLADRLSSEPSAGTWVAFAAVGALGLYTIPVMLYPLGTAAAWLLLAGLRQRGEARRRIVAGVVVSSAAACALALLLYLPIIRSAGLGALAGNRFVAPSAWPAFLAALPRHAVELVVTWSAPAPPVLAPLVLLLALLGLRRREESERPSLAVAAAIWCGALLVVTHRVPFVRVWLFLLPLALLSVARGVLRLPWLARLPAAQVALPVAAALALVALVGRDAERSDDTGAFPPAREVVDRIGGELRAGDRILAPIPTNGPLLYYLGARGLDTAVLNTPPALTRRAYLVLEPARGRTLEWAVQRGIIDPAQFREPALLLRRPDVELWRTDRR